MTSSTSSWALDQDLPCAPKFVLFRLCDNCGMSREVSIDVARYAADCGLTSAELIEAVNELNSTGTLQILARSEATIDVRLLYPTQDFEEPAGRRVAAQPNNTPGWLYILGTNHGISKVGITTDLPSRVESLNTNAAIDVRLAWSHACVITRARELEKALLEHFRASRFKGEWLRIDAIEVVKVAEAMVASR